MSELIALRDLHENNSDAALYYARIDFFAYDGTPRQIAGRYGIPFTKLMEFIPQWTEERREISEGQTYKAITLQTEHLETVVARACELTLKALERAERLGLINSVADAEKLATIAAKLHKPLQLSKELPTEIHASERTKSIEEVLNEIRELDVLCDYEVFNGEH